VLKTSPHLPGCGEIGLVAPTAQRLHNLGQTRAFRTHAREAALSVSTLGAARLRHVLRHRVVRATEIGARVAVPHAVVLLVGKMEANIAQTCRPVHDAGSWRAARCDGQSAWWKPAAAAEAQASAEPR